MPEERECNCTVVINREDIKPLPREQSKRRAVMFGSVTCRWCGSFETPKFTAHPKAGLTLIKMAVSNWRALETDCDLKIPPRFQ